jgi:hypothetical protein
MATQNGLAVYDFDDTHSGAVTVSVRGKDFVLAPGRHALISKNAGKGFEFVNAAQLFAYRSITQQAIAGTGDGPAMHAFTADFSLPQAITTVMPLQRLVTSTHPQARKIAQRLLKTTTIMEEMTAGGEQYHQVFRPSMVASR